jgi:hypothetical protein
MKTFLSRSAVSRLSRQLHVPVAAGALLLTIAGCAGNAASRAPSAVSDSDFARLVPGQTQRVDEARAQVALARDELGRAKLSALNDQHEGALARSDQAAASADKSRAAAETRIGKDSNEPGQIQQARDDTATARQGKEVADARLAYSKKLATSRAAEITAAERKVDLMVEKVNLAKLQSLDDAAIPAAGKYDHATAMEQVVKAQHAFDRATAAAAKAGGETAKARGHWEQLARDQT